jgi:hypothetical protein
MNILLAQHVYRIAMLPTWRKKPKWADKLIDDLLGY